VCDIQRRRIERNIDCVLVVARILAHGRDRKSVRQRMPRRVLKSALTVASSASSGSRPCSTSVRRSGRSLTGVFGRSPYSRVKAWSF
jgi:hypothetical protein